MLLLVTTALGVLLTLADIPRALPAIAQSAQDQRLPLSRCDPESEKLLGQKPVRVGKKIRAPRKIHDVKIVWPSAGERRIAGVWIGEALIERDGTIQHAWTLRDFQATPPWPEASEAALTAIKQWRFTPTKVNGRAVPVCMTITVHIDFQ